MMSSLRSTIEKVGLAIGLLAIFGGSSLMNAGAKLTATNKDISTLEIRLKNDEPVAGLQFILRSSQGVILKEIHRSGRTAKGSWMVASNRVNDSTLSVVIVSSDMTFFADGNGVVAEMTITQQQIPGTVGLVEFDRVVIADPQAQLVTVTSTPLLLNSQNPPSAVSSPIGTMGQNYPNPFNPATRISYDLKKGADVHLSVFDVMGRETSRLVDRYQNEGSYTVTWNSLESRWGQLASGTYFVRLQVGNTVVTRKMLLTK
jgi:hypothetical protein